MFISEEDPTVRRIKDFVKDGKPYNYSFIMLRNGRTLVFVDYSEMVKAGKITPQDVYVYIEPIWSGSKATFYYPFLHLYGVLVIAYLSKLGFVYGTLIVPASGLKYITFAIRYSDYLSIELTNLDTVVNNTNLHKIVVEVLGGKLISGEKLTAEEYSKILDMLRPQKLFVGYNVNKARDILSEYYDKGNKSLAKEVARIAMDYDRIFHPYRVCYDMDRWDEVGCWSIKL